MKEDGEELHRRAIVLDSHVDTPSRILYEGFRLEGRPRSGHVDIPRLREGGVGAVVFALFVDREYASRPGLAAAEALRMLDAARREVERHPGELEIADGARGVRDARARGRIAVLFGLEGGHALEDDPRRLAEFRSLGVRYVTLTHVNTNGWCDSSGDAPRWGGLNDLGVEMIREMNRLGIVPDVSHASDAAVARVLETSRAPIVASHSSCRSLCDGPRNLTDEQISAIGAAGGVVMINVYPAFICGAYRAAYARWETRHEEDLRRIRASHPDDPWRRWTDHGALLAAHPPDAPPPGIDRVADHVLHAIRLAGPGHVGLGSDFDGIPCVPEGLEDCGAFPRLTARLLERGASPDAVLSVLGENFLRLLDAADAVAQDSGTSAR